MFNSYLLAWFSHIGLGKNGVVGIVLMGFKKDLGNERNLFVYTEPDSLLKIVKI